LILSLLILPVVAQSDEDLTTLGGDEAMRNETRNDVIGMLTRMFGPFTTFKIEGAQGIWGLFSPEFLAAFFIMYFLLGEAAAFQIQGMAPAKMVGGGLPKIVVTLFLTYLVWNALGGMRFERLLILMVPPMLVYYILIGILKNFALLSSGVAQLISLSSAIIAFLFYSPQFVSYLDGRFQYGILDSLALSGGVFFAVYMFGFFLTKFTNEVISPLNARGRAAETQRMLQQQIDELPASERSRVAGTLNIVKQLSGGGGG
jgi:hypothetical protein